MKKIITLLIMFFACIATINAKNCIIVSGDGTKIGDEIACGTEHFYVLENDGTNVKMLAKYNLYVGFNHELIKLDKSFDTEEDVSDYAYELYGEEYEDLIDIIQDEDGKYSSVVLYKELDETEVKQNSEAIGAHGDEKGNPNPTQKGVISLREGGYAVYGGYSEPYGGGYYYDYTLLKDGLIEPYMTRYYESLNKEYNIQAISMLSVQDLNNLVAAITTKELPLEQWGKEAHDKEYNISSVYVVGSLKEYLPENYSWIYSTTYWTRTVADPNESNTFIYFVDTLGDLCAVGSCGDVVGAGLRPVVTLSSDNIVPEETPETPVAPEVENPETTAINLTIAAILIVISIIIFIRARKKADFMS